MNKYFKQLNPIIKEYFNILSPDGIPEFLYDYIDTPEMQRIGKISMNCGTDYTKVFNIRFFYSNLEHSIGVALIVWHFTKDKKQTLSGLFHDIATPTFKHCIDFMNGDYEKQESTEELTTEIIKNSKQIMELLKRDNILVEEIDDYHKYPIADNDTPKLSADRFEYNFSSGLSLEPVWKSLEDIKEVYENITILTNEEGEQEIGFKDVKIAEKYISIVSNLWPVWITNKDKLCMQFIADIVKAMFEKSEITKRDLYTLSEEQIIFKIENSNDSNIRNSFKKFRNATKIGESDYPVEGKYCRSIVGKKRYVNPLVNTNKGSERISDVSQISNAKILNYLNNTSVSKKYAYFNFEF